MPSAETTISTKYIAKRSMYLAIYTDAIERRFAGLALCAGYAPARWRACV